METNCTSPGMPLIVSIKIQLKTGIRSWQEKRTPKPYFRLESEAKIRQWLEYVSPFLPWKASFSKALDELKQDLQSVSVRKFI